LLQSAFGALTPKALLFLIKTKTLRHKIFCYTQRREVEGEIGFQLRAFALKKHKICLESVKPAGIACLLTEDSAPGLSSVFSSLSLLKLKVIFNNYESAV
jgi:hypothetical protein